MTDALASAVARLRLEREASRTRLRRLRSDFDEIVAASVDSNADDEHDPEGATIAFERSQVGSLARQTEHRLEEVEAALRRVEAGTYGVCERCGRSIPQERIEARPTARTCVPCTT